MPSFQQSQRGSGKCHLPVSAIGGGKGGKCSKMQGAAWMLKTQRRAASALEAKVPEMAAVLPESPHAQINALLAIAAQSFIASRRIEALQTLSNTLADTTTTNSGWPCDNLGDVTAQLCAHSTRAVSAEEKALAFQALAAFNIYRSTSNELFEPCQIQKEVNACKEAIIAEEDPAVQIAALHTLALSVLFHADASDTRLLMAFVSALIPGSCPVSDDEEEIDPSNLPWESENVTIIDAAISSLNIMMAGLPVRHQVEFAIPAFRAVCHQNHVTVGNECKQSTKKFLGLLKDAFSEMEGETFTMVRDIVEHESDAAVVVMRLKGFTFRIESWATHIIVDALRQTLGGGLPLQMCESLLLQEILGLPDLSYAVPGHLTMVERLDRDNTRRDNTRQWQYSREEGRQMKLDLLSTNQPED